MAFKLRATNGSGKQYLQPKTMGGVVGREWIYVSEDPATTVDGSGYITAATGEDHELAIGMLRVGDLVWSYQVAGIDDDRDLEADMAGGITDISLHAVLVNDGSVIDLSDDLLAATVTYGD